MKLRTNLFYPPRQLNWLSKQSAFLQYKIKKIAYWNNSDCPLKNRISLTVAF